MERSNIGRTHPCETDIARHAKVGQLDGKTSSHQAIASGQVSVDDAHLLYVRQTAGRTERHAPEAIRVEADMLKIRKEVEGGVEQKVP